MSAKTLIEGMVAYAAVVDAGLSRFRPIILSTITTVLGMIPLFLSGPFWSPMATVIMAGLLFGTLLTLLVAPALYCLFMRVKAK